jgi:CspA family cold shock protein
MHVDNHRMNDLGRSTGRLAGFAPRNLRQIVPAGGSSPVMSMGAAILSSRRCRAVFCQRTTVLWFDRLEGYGFIVADVGEDVMDHFSAIEGEGFRCLRVGQRVEYDARRTWHDLQAARVRRLADHQP